MTIYEKFNYLLSKINWNDSALDAKSIEIMNNLNKDIKIHIDEMIRLQIQYHQKQIEALEQTDAYENGVPMSDLFENENRA